MTTKRTKKLSTKIKQFIAKRKHLSAAVFSLSLLLVSLDFPFLSAHHKVQFINQPAYLRDDYNYVLQEDFLFTVDDQKYIIPRSFETDFEFVPPIAINLIEYHFPEIAYPAIISDYFYRCPGRRSRLYADHVFYNALLEEDFTQPMAAAMYYAIRYVGEPHFIKGNTCERL